MLLRARWRLPEWLQGTAVSACAGASFGVRHCSIHNKLLADKEDRQSAQVPAACLWESSLRGSDQKAQGTWRRASMPAKVHHCSLLQGLTAVRLLESSP